MLHQGGRGPDVRVSQEAKASQALKDTSQLKKRVRVQLLGPSSGFPGFG